MQREMVLPEPPPGIPQIDTENFKRHFQDRFEAEQKYYGYDTPQNAFSGIPVRYCDLQTLNTLETRDFVLAQKSDLVFIFGAGIIKEPVMSALPHDKVNMHLGLSPWYRGSATFFWPFYNLEPQYCATTFHQINPAVDGGAIIHHTPVDLEQGDGIHDVATKLVVKSRGDIVRLLRLRQEKPFTEVPQTTAGRLYLTKHFRPEHLRVIYNLYDNDIVDAYLRGEFLQHQPKLVTAF